MLEKLKESIIDVPNFPKAGIIFKDITPLLENPAAFSQVIDSLRKLLPEGTEKLVAIESRGFIFGAALAQATGLGLTLVRKPGKLPRETVSHTYALEYGEDTLEIHRTALRAGERVVIVDDVLATGGTAQATEKLCTSMKAEVAGFLFLMELSFLNGRDKLIAPSSALITY